MNKILALATFSLLLFTGCQQVPSEPVVEEPQLEEPQVEVEDETAAASERYTWEEKGISFEVPEGLMVTEKSGSLFLSEENVTAQGDSETAQGTRSIHIQENITVEEQANSFSTSEEFSKETVSIGGQSFVKVSYKGNMTGEMETMHMIQNGEDVIYIFAGEGEAAQTLLETLKF